MRLTDIFSIVTPRGNPRNYAISFSPYLRGRPTTVAPLRTCWRPRATSAAPVAMASTAGPITFVTAAVSRRSRSGHRQRTDRRPGRAAHVQRRADEQELGRAEGGQA